MTVYYLGPEGSFTEEAAIKLFALERLAPSSSIEDVLESVKNERDALGIVPIENTLEGIVIRTLDLILKNKLKVVAEISIPIVQNLLSKEDSLQKITKIYSHPHAIAQTHEWIKTHLKGVSLLPTESTSKSAEIAEKEAGSAAIASKRAGELYHLNVLAEKISSYHQNTHAYNITRFWVVSFSKQEGISQFSTEKLSLNTKASYYIIIKDKVGALKELFETFTDKFISLTSIQSRPLINEPWKYGFFIDLLADGEDPLAMTMFANLKKIHPLVIMLGTYPQYGVFNNKAAIAYNEKRIYNIFSLHNKHQLLRQNINDAIKQFAKEPPSIKKIITTRLLIMPSVAYCKYVHNLKVEDKIREKNLLRGIKTYDTVNRLFMDIIAQSKQLQKKTVQLLASHKITQKDIIQFSIQDLRYYIDYLDKLIVTRILNRET